MHPRALLLALAALATGSLCLTDRERLLESSMLRTHTEVSRFFDGVTTAARVAAMMVAKAQGVVGDSGSALADLSLGLDPRTGARYLHDARPGRSSEFYVSSGALAAANVTDDDASGCPAGGAVGAAVLECRTACAVAEAAALSATLDTFVYSFADKVPASSWRWTVGSGAGNADWGRVWASYGGGGDAAGSLSLAPLGLTFSSVHGGRTGNRLSNLTFPRGGPGDDAPLWSSPYRIGSVHPPTVTVGAPSWTAEGRYVGGFFADVRLSRSAELLGNASDGGGSGEGSRLAGLVHVLVAANGDVVSGDAAGLQLLFNSTCLASPCNVLAALPHAAPLLLADGPGQQQRQQLMYHVSATVRGRRHEVFGQRVAATGWVLLTVVRSSVLYPPRGFEGAVAVAVTVPCAAVALGLAAALAAVWRFYRNEVHELRDKLGTVASTAVLGSPAEDVVATLLRIQAKRALSSADRAELFHVVTLVATNKLYKADSNLKKKIEALNLESDVDAYLVDVLAKGDGGDPGSVMASRNSTMSESGSACEAQGIIGELRTDALSGGGTGENGSLDVVANANGGPAVAPDSWDYDVAAIAVPEGRRLLEVVGVHLLERQGLVEHFHLSGAKLRCYLRALDKGYRKHNAYHNALHAADVAMALCWLMRGCVGFEFSRKERLAAVVAGLAHDYRHPGVNNNYLLATADPLAYRFNGASVLENMHCSEAMSLLFLSADCDFAEALKPAEARELHRLVCQLVLATDMARHVELTSQFGARIASGTLGNTKGDRLLVLQMLVKMADVSNSARAWPVCRRWAEAVMQEFYAQGDRERQQGLPVSPFMDRATTDVAKCQTAFIQFVVQPMAELVAKVNPRVADTLVANLRANALRWKDYTLASSTTAAEAQQPPVGAAL
eukprot:m51a1_g6131 putative 3 -cyclic-nucleotide phosphodiesterase (899) ;mRNA; f:228805-231846